MHPELLEKLRALLSKTTEAGCTEAEAEAAMEAAQRIAARNNIDLASVRVEGGAAVPIETDRADLRGRCDSRRPYHEAIAQVLMQCFGVRLMWFGDTSRAVIVGEKTDVAIAQYCWGWLEGVMQRLYARYLESLPLGVRRDTILARSYHFGLSAGIIRRNRRVAAEAAEQGGTAYALVIADKEAHVAERFRREFAETPMRTRRRRKRMLDPHAYQSGEKDGGTIALNHALT